MGIPCFMVKPTDREIVFLNRYEHGACPLAPESDIHHAVAPIGERDIVWTERDGRRFIAARSLEDHASDHRWPSHCGCGQEFTSDSRRNLFGRQLYRRPETGETRPVDGVHWWPALEPWGAGAMFDAWWLHDDWRGSDGLALSVVLPGGSIWHIDSEATGGGRWERTGTPPRITARPSILDAKGSSREYHGFLTDGELVAV